MKITINQSELNAAINIVLKAISNKTTIDILKSIYIEAKDNTIKLIGNDLSIGIETVVNANVIKEGQCTISARIFGDIIKKLPDEEIEITIDEKYNINIKCINSEFNLIGSNPSEYPELPIVNPDEKINIDKYLFSDMIRQTIFATSQDESRPILTGSLLKIENGEMTMVAIDLYRVAIRKIKLNTEHTCKVVIPARALNELMKIITSESKSETIEIYTTDKYIKFKIDNIVIITRLLEGEFINYEQIMPTEFSSLVKFSKEEMFKAIDRASLIANQGKNVSLLFDVQNNSIDISSNVEVGSVKEKVNIELEGPILKIGFNPRYWLDMLRVIDSDELKIELTTNVSPCIIRPIDNDYYTYLLLPVRILN